MKPTHSKKPISLLTDSIFCVASNFLPFDTDGRKKGRTKKVPYTIHIFSPLYEEASRDYAYNPNPDNYIPVQYVNGFIQKLNIWGRIFELYVSTKDAWEKRKRAK